MKTYTLRVTDLGKPKGVPTLVAHLICSDPPIEYAVMSSGDLSPGTAEALVESFAAFGVAVVRESRDLSDVWPVSKPRKPAKKEAVPCPT